MTPIFLLVLPLELAPTLNEYANKKGWAKTKLAQAIDWRIMDAMRSWPAWGCGVIRGPKTKTGRPGKAVGGRKRIVHVTRHSSREPDELSADVIGGKIAIDRLVHANILRDDSREWCERKASWQKAAPKDGRLVVEVFETGGGE